MRLVTALAGLSGALLLGLAAPAAPARAALEVPDGAYAEGAPDEGNPRVEARLLFDAAEVRPGEPFSAGVLFDLDRGWHVYWRNPGEAGLPTKLDWSAPGARVGPIRWPGPSVYSESDGSITTYGYADTVLLTNEVVFEPGVRGARELAVDVDFLVCEVRCIPGRVELRREIRVGDASRPAEPRARELFERWASRVPLPAEALGLEVQALYSQSAIRPGDDFRAAIAVVSCAAPGTDPDACETYTPGTRDPSHAFVPDALDGVELRTTGSGPHPLADDGFLVTLSGSALAEAPAVPEQRLSGVLALRAGRQLRFAEVAVPLPRAAAGAEVALLDHAWLEPADRPPTLPFWHAVLGALVGGLILNLMPCVLPVLAIKVFGIAELAHQSRREVLASGVAYTAGILATMALLAAVVAGLRAAGTFVGWGFQFQEPLFVAVVSAVMLIFALNLFGVFEIYVNATGLAQMSERASGLRRSFFEGLLCVIVATPCTAPFLGAAVGFAFAGSTPVIVAIFLAIGLGLASPYVLVTLVPGWSRVIPRPGAWMLRLRQVLGFFLLGSVVWMLWVVRNVVGVDGLLGLLAFLVAIGFATWVYGTLRAAERPRLALASGLALASVALAGLSAVPLDASRPLAAAPGGAELPWRPFSRSAVGEELERGRAVFVYFTADWCLTCEVNERTVLSDARVLAEVERLDVAVFKADWTRRDETIREELARFGRAGVPMYLLYDPDAPGRPEVLPELLTLERVLEALRRATPAVAAAAVPAPGEDP